MSPRSQNGEELMSTDETRVDSSTDRAWIPIPLVPKGEAHIKVIHADTELHQVVSSSSSSAPGTEVYSTFSGLPRNASRASHTAACANGPSRTTRAPNRSDSAGGTEVLTSQRQCRGLRGRPMSAALRPAAAREASLPRLLGRPAGRHRRRRPRSVLSQTPPRGRRPSLRSPRGVQD